MIEHRIPWLERKLTDAVLVTSLKVVGVVVRGRDARVGVDVQSRLLERGADDGQACLTVESLGANFANGGGRVAALHSVQAGVRAAAGRRAAAAAAAAVLSTGTAVAVLRAAVSGSAVGTA